MLIRTITSTDNLEALAQQINSAQWDAGNEMARYSAAALDRFLADPANLFIAAYVDEGGSRLGGVASARVALKPYESQCWLYIDEVDTCADLRRRGIGTALLRWLLTVAEERGCNEVWLGTEADNRAANGLYRSLQPAAVEEVVGYTFAVPVKTA